MINGIKHELCFEKMHLQFRSDLVEIKLTF